MQAGDGYSGLFGEYELSTAYLVSSYILVGSYRTRSRSAASWSCLRSKLCASASFSEVVTRNRKTSLATCALEASSLSSALASMAASCA